MRKSAKLITALSVAGLAVAAGSAFTGAGLMNAAGSSQFVGGQVSQTVTGATLSNLQYGFTDATKTAVNQVTLTFAPGSDDKTVQLSLAGGGTATFVCDPIADNVSVCDPADPGTTKTDVTSATVTVS